MMTLVLGRLKLNSKQEAFLSEFGAHDFYVHDYREQFTILVHVHGVHVHVHGPKKRVRPYRVHVHVHDAACKIVNTVNVNMYTVGHESCTP